MKYFLKPFALIVTGLSLFSACKKDDYPNPELLPDSANRLLDTISVGDSLVLRPRFSNLKDMRYAWSVNEEAKSNDSVFVFKPSTGGDYKVKLSVTNAGGEAELQYHIVVYGKYVRGFFILNEGWFGHGPGTVSYFNYKTRQLSDSVFIKENRDKQAMPSPLQYGAIYNGEFFLASKAGGPVVKADAASLKEKGRVASGSGNDWRAVLALDNKKAVLSSSKGLYLLNTEAMTVGEKIGSETTQIADLYQTADYIFAVSQSKGLLIIDKKDYTTRQTIAGIIGCAITPNGDVWAVGGTKILKIKQDLSITEYVCPFSISGSWFAWHPAPVVASATENAIFFERTSGYNGSGTTIYKFSGDVSSLNQAFATIPSGYIFYGGLGYDKQNNVLVATAIYGWAESDKNTLFFFDPLKGGEATDQLSYSGYHFPSSFAFH